MSAAAILQLINIASLLVEQIIPQLTAALKAGEISVDQQQALKEKIAALKEKLETRELGSHWDVPDRG